MPQPTNLSHPPPSPSPSPSLPSSSAAARRPPPAAAVQPPAVGSSIGRRVGPAEYDQPEDIAADLQGMTSLHFLGLGFDLRCIRVRL